MCARGISPTQLGGLKHTGRIVLPEDGPVSWTARADLAEAAVSTLLDTDLFEGISPPLTSSEALIFADLAKVASELLGRPVAREAVTDEEYRMGLISHGIPEVMASALGTLYIASRALEFTVVDPALGRLLGRDPTAMKDVLNKFLSGPESKVPIPT